MTATSRPREHLCRMPDGAALRGWLWEAAVPAGTVVIRTPYEAARHAATGRSWSARGYHCLIQDVRGRYRSDGEWDPYQREGDDGAEVLAQMAREHPRLPVVVFGASYAAHTALEAARGAVARGLPAPAAVIALVPALGLAETARDHAGAPQVWHRIGWWHEHGRARRSRPPLPRTELDRRTARAETVGVAAAAEGWGWTSRALAQWQRLWEADRLELAIHYASLTAPLLVISGEQDFFDADAHRLAQSWAGTSHLVTGPWGHGLAGDVTEPGLRERLRSTGGVGGVIDAWLAAHELPGSAANWTSILADAPYTQSRFDAADGAWHHERSAP